MDPSVLAVLDPEVDLAVRGGHPLPERDIESQAFSVALPLPFTGAAPQELASYLEPARAGGAGLFQPAAAPRRYTLFRVRGETSQAGNRALPPVVHGSLKEKSEHSLDYSVIAAVDRAAPAWDQLRPALEAARALETVTSAADVGSDTVHCFSVNSSLLLSATAGPAIDLSWLRELAPGRVRGDVGLTINGGAEATLEVTLAGNFSATVRVDDSGRLRVQVYKQDCSNLNLPASVTVAAKWKAPPVAAVRELAAALLGVHQLQWLGDLCETVRNGIPASLEKKLNLPAADLAKFFALWGALEGNAAVAIWNAAASAAGLSTLAAWTARITNELRDIGSFDAALGTALEADPGFSRSAAALWMEAVAGSLAAAAVDPLAFARLQQGAAAAAAILSETGMVAVLEGLQRYAAAATGTIPVTQALDSLRSYSNLDPWVRKQVEEMCGPVTSLLDLTRAGGYLGTLTNLAERAYGQAVLALERKTTAELSFQFNAAAEKSALIDCSFPFTPDGLALYRRALTGDFRGLLAAAPECGAVLHRGTLTHTLRGQTRLELSLPFIGRKDRCSMWQALAKVEIRPGENGRMLAYSVEALDQYRRGTLFQSALTLSGGLQVGGRVRSAADFNLSWTSVRHFGRSDADGLQVLLAAYEFSEAPQSWLQSLPADATVEATLSLSAPGSYASAWLDAPSEQDRTHVPVFSAMSVAVQAAMRRWLPWVYFEDIDRYNDLGAALPLLIYQCTAPCEGDSTAELTYDFMQPELPGLGRIQSRLKIELAQVSARLAAAGRTRLADFYAPDEARQIVARVVQFPYQYKSLLAADAFLVDTLVTLAAHGRSFRSRSGSEPERAVSELAKFAESFVKAFHGRLRRLYGGEDFASFGPLLLVEATTALFSALAGTPARIAAVLRLSATGPAGAAEQTLVNAAFRP